MSGLLDPTSLRSVANQIGLRPTKTRGQNFVHDANTVRRIVALAGVDAHDRVTVSYTHLTLPTKRIV